MKFFSWMQRKLNGKAKFQSTSKLHENEPSEEISPPLPHALLTIGTFGTNNELKGNCDTNTDNGKVIDDSEDRSRTEETEDCSLEDVLKLKEELMEIISLQKSHTGVNEIELSPLENYRRDDEVMEIIRRNISFKSNDDYHKFSVAKRSISFLVKKVFVCGIGFAPLESLPPPPLPPPGLSDTLQDSRMKKILKILLEKKIHPQNYSQTSSLKRYIKENEMRKKRNEDLN